MQREAWWGLDGSWKPREHVSAIQVLLKLQPLARGEGDCHPIINKWGGGMGGSEPGDGVLLPGSNDLRAMGRRWACHYLAPLTFEPSGGAG
jgi:hypothetical protein